MQKETKEFTVNFIENQRIRISKRIDKYQGIEKIREELESGDISPYSRYKQINLVPILFKALKKIQEGRYGICEKCGKQIERKRLELVPAAELCLECIKPKTNQK